MSPEKNSSLPCYQLGLLLSLYLAEGLPVGFLTQALPAILRHHHVSLAAIGGFGLLMAPWACKFLWAPVVDRYYSRQFGQSRCWIVPLAVLSLLALLGISFFDPMQLTNPALLICFFALLLLLNLCGATQDIATDALAVRMLSRDSQHWGNAIQVLGSRLGFIFGGGVMLLLLDIWSWQSVFLLLTLFVFLNSLPVLFYKEPQWLHQQQIQHAQQDIPRRERFRQFMQTEVAHFWQSPIMRCWLLVLLTFKLGDGLSAAMVKPMMVDMGFKLSQIGLMVSVLGTGAALSGAVLAGWFIQRVSRLNAVWLLAVMQAASISLYALLAWQYQTQHIVIAWQVYAANAIEHTVRAMALVAVLTLIMDYSRKQQAGSDYTFQVSIMATIDGGTHVLSGLLAGWLGYQLHFMFSAALALLCLVPVFIWRRQVRLNQLLERAEA